MNLKQGEPVISITIVIRNIILYFLQRCISSIFFNDNMYWLSYIWLAFLLLGGMSLLLTYVKRNRYIDFWRNFRNTVIIIFCISIVPDFIIFIMVR